MRWPDMGFVCRMSIKGGWCCVKALRWEEHRDDAHISYSQQITEILFYSLDAIKIKADINIIILN